MPLYIRQGDLFHSGLPALAHGCNCQGVMGAGIAAQFRERWPAMYTAYRDRCKTGGFRLGGYMTWSAPPVMIYCLATQKYAGPEARLDAIAVSVSKMLLDAEAAGITAIGLPKIGCGIGGLLWADVGYLLEVLAAPSLVELIVHIPEERHG